LGDCWHGIFYKLDAFPVTNQLDRSTLFSRPFSGWTWVSQYQNVSIMDFTGTKDEGGGGDKWSYNTCKASAKSSPSANQHPAFYIPDALPVTVSPNLQYRSSEGKNNVRALKEVKCN